MNTFTPFLLRIPRLIFQEMVDQARLEAPLECCGLLAGTIAEGIASVSHRYPLVNALASPVAFQSDPASMFQAIRQMRPLQLEILAIYHSHPASAPIPSRSDLAQNYSERVANLIIGLRSDPPEVRGWWLTDSSYQPAIWEWVD